MARHLFRNLLFVLLVNLLVSTSGRTLAQVQPVPEDIRKQFALDEFYQKYLDVGGLPIVGSSGVSDAAILEAAWIVKQMLGDRGDILKAMAHNNTRMAVMAHDEFTTDIPEHSKLEPRVYWDRRARGLGATPEAPAVSCAEENLLCHPDDPYRDENICIHEFAHAIHSMGMPDVDSSFDERLRTAYQAALDAGLWKETYAASNAEEYWAEAVQSWFDDNREDDALHNHVNTRAELKLYDPKLAALCHQVFGDGDWRYKKPMARLSKERSHLIGVDFAGLPAFRWRKESIPDAPEVLIQTTAGDITVVLDRKRAPKTVENFLHYVHEGFYADGAFHRALTSENQTDVPYPIAIIQAAADESRKSALRPAIPLERTRDTGLRHLAGTISMARDEEPDSALHDFFICTSDLPQLDFGGRRNPDGQGFAAFGKVTAGMDVVRAIQRSNKQGEQLAPPVKIQRAIRMN